MSFHDVVTDVKPQSVSSAGCFCGKKRLENIPADGIGNAGSRILTFKDNLMMDSVNIGFQKNGSGRWGSRLNGILYDIQSHLAGRQNSR